MALVLWLPVIAPSFALRRLITPAAGALISVRASLTAMSRPCAMARARSAVAMASAWCDEFSRALAERAAASR